MSKVVKEAKRGFKKVEKETGRAVDKVKDNPLLVVNPMLGVQSEGLKTVAGTGILGGNTGASDYEKEMANLTNLQAQMAAGQYKFWETTHKPWEKEQIAANRELIPLEVKNAKAKLESESTLYPLMTDAEKARLVSEKTLYPFRTENEKARLEADTGLIDERAANERAHLITDTELVPHKYAYDKSRLVNAKNLSDQLVSLTNVSDAEMKTRMNDASADVTHQFTGAESDIAANSMRYGIGALGHNLAENSADKAKASANARNMARKQGYNDKYNRTLSALGAIR